jgi:predicted metallopeptidase
MGLNNGYIMECIGENRLPVTQQLMTFTHPICRLHKTPKQLTCFLLIWPGN